MRLFSMSADMHRSALAVSTALALAAATLLATPSGATGAPVANPTLYVNSEADGPPFRAALGGASVESCESADGSEGQCRLRDAIFWANQEPDVQTIEFLDGVELIVLNIPPAGPPADVSTGSLDIIWDLIVNGAGVTVEADFVSGGREATSSPTWTGLGGTAEEGGVFTVSSVADQTVFAGDVSTSVTVNGLTVQGGDAEEGGGYLVRPGNSLTLDQGAQVLDNVAGTGGGIGLQEGASLLTRGNTVVAGNLAELGGGIMGFVDSQADLSLTEVSGNQALFAGGGIFLDGLLRVTDSQVIDNAVAAPEEDKPRFLGVEGLLPGGGGINVSASDNAESVRRLEITDSTVSRNAAEFSFAGGIAVVLAESFDLTGSVVTGNGIRFSPVTPTQPEGPAAPQFAGGIAAFSTPTAIASSTISDNEAFIFGAGVAAVRSSFSNDAEQETTPLTIQRSAIQDNDLIDLPEDGQAQTFLGGEGFDAQTGGGLGLSAEDGVLDVDIANSTFDGNRGSLGAGIAALAAPAELLRALPVTPRTEGLQIGGGQVDVQIAHTTIVDNVITPIAEPEPGEPDESHALFGYNDVEMFLYNTLIQGEGQACSLPPTDSESGPDPVVTSLGGNSANDDSCNLVNTGDAQNQTDPDLLTAALPTPHRPLPEGHSAIDAGISAPVAPVEGPPRFSAGFTCEGTLDQTGAARFMGEGCDRGAVEFNPEPPPGPGPGPDPTDPPPMPGNPNTPDRVGGPTRLETAVLGSQALFEDSSADTVVLARSDLFPDAQAGAPLAVERSAPLLLTQPDVLSTPTEAEIRRVLRTGGTVVLLGGDAAISSAVADRVAEIGYPTVRYGGLNRFGTAVAIAADGLGTPGTVLLADGGDFHPSIVAGAAAVVAGGSTIGEVGGQVDAAVLLTSGGDMAPETAGYIDTSTQTVTTIGSAAGQAYPAAPNVGGDAPDDPTLSVAVAEAFFDQPRAFGVATTTAFADALSGSSIVGSPRYGPGPMLFSQPDGLPAVVSAYVTSIASGVERSLLLGGTAALSTAVADQVEAALDDG